MHRPSQTVSIPVSSAGEKLPYYVILAPCQFLPLRTNTLSRWLAFGDVISLTTIFVSSSHTEKLFFLLLFPSPLPSYCFLFGPSRLYGLCSKLSVTELHFISLPLSLPLTADATYMFCSLNINLLDTLWILGSAVGFKYVLSP